MTLDDLQKQWDKDRKWEKDNPIKAWFLDLRYVPIRLWNGIEWKYLAVKHGFQRMFRGYDDTAFWGLDSYITRIALPVLKKYRKEKVGVPMLRSVDEDFDTAQKEWNEILDKMILSFELLQKDDSVDLDYSEESFNKINEGLVLFAKHFRALWD